MDLKDFLKKFWPYILIIILSLIVSWPVFLPGYFPHHDDLQVMRIFEMRHCFDDFQIPCRWVPDMGYGNGYPLFNYYNVFPYYIGGLASYFIGFIGSAKLLFFIAAFSAGITMFLLAKELFSLYPALLASIMYIFAPYRALDIYVRGAISESFALAIVPLIFYFALKLLKGVSKKSILGLTLSLGAFLTSHTIMTLLFAPLILIFLILVFWGRGKLIISSIIFSLLLGFGLSAFFTIPAYFEKDLVEIENLARMDLDFRAHFVTLNQLFFDRYWGYGASFPGEGDTISFQIGWPHWILAFLSVPSLLIWKKNKKFALIYLTLFLFFVFSLFMTHNKSAFIWEKIGLLRFVQFPWRFLALAIFTSVILSAFLLTLLRPFLVKIIFLIFVSATIFLNLAYFQPEGFYFNLTDEDKLSGELWDKQQKASILDYLPKGAIESKERASNLPIIVSGDSTIGYFENKSNQWELKINVKSPSKIEFPVYDFPNWKVYRNDVEIEHSKDNYLGRISINLENGDYMIRGKFTDTPIRKYSNGLSFISAIVILYFIFYEKIRKIFR